MPMLLGQQVHSSMQHCFNSLQVEGIWFNNELFSSSSARMNLQPYCIQYYKDVKETTKEYSLLKKTHQEALLNFAKYHLCKPYTQWDNTLCYEARIWTQFPTANHGDGNIIVRELFHLNIQDNCA